MSTFGTTYLPSSVYVDIEWPPIWKNWVLSKFRWSKKCPFFWASIWWTPIQKKFGTFFYWGFPFFTSLLKTPEPWPLHYYSWIIRDKPDHRVIRMRNMFSEKKSLNVLVIKFIYYLLTLQILLISTLSKQLNQEWYLFFFWGFERLVYFHFRNKEFNITNFWLKVRKSQKIFLEFSILPKTKNWKNL